MLYISVRAALIRNKYPVCFVIL